MQSNATQIAGIVLAILVLGSLAVGGAAAADIVSLPSVSVALTASWTHLGLSSDAESSPPNSAVGDGPWDRAVSRRLRSRLCRALAHSLLGEEVAIPPAISQIRGPSCDWAAGRSFRVSSCILTRLATPPSPRKLNALGWHDKTVIV